MSISVILSSGGIKSAVTTGRVASTHELVVVHVDYGQSNASAQVHAIQSHLGALPRAHLVRLHMPCVLELQDAQDQHVRQGDQRIHSRANQARQATPDGAVLRTGVLSNAPINGPGQFSREPLAPASLRGLFPALCTMGMQCALRYNAEEVVTGLTVDGAAMHLGWPISPPMPDARRQFIHAFNIAWETLAPKGHTVHVKAPLVGLSYAEIIKLAERLEVPFESTWTCDTDNAKPCGQCEPCRTRAAAFAQCHLADPLIHRPVKVH